MEKKYCKLIMVTSDNNNKYYEMIYEGGDTFTVNYGRVEQSKITLTKPIREWEKLYSSKVKKGYKDRTELVAVTITESKVKKNKDGLKEIVNAKVREFINKMKSYTANLVDTTYSVKADKVSQKQIDTAQDLINQINKLIEVDKADRDENEINILLIDLYGVIPRWIKNVRTEILPHIDIDKVIQDEQDKLDAMASQVQTIATDDALTAETEDEVVEQKTFLDVLGVTMEETTDYSEIDYIMKQLGAYKIDKVYKIDKPVENKIFNAWIDKSKNKKTRFLIHGTRCTSVIPIIQTGLKVRPAGNFAFSGKAYGDGNYFSEHAAKSLNYTGSDKDQILFVYEVHVGNVYTYSGWYNGPQGGVTLSLHGLTSKGYDSTYVKPGNGLQNSEIIAYHEHQSRIRYAIHITRNSRW